MQALVLVLHKVEILDELLVNLQNNGVAGGTIIDSQGMLNATRDSNSLIDSLKIFLEEPRDASKTIFFILKDEDVQRVKDIINETLGGIDKPHTGIMFGLDLSFVEGIKLK